MLEVSIVKRLGDFDLDAEFACETHGVVALFGRSGVGKTTVVNALAGLVRPDSGRIAINGTTLFDSSQGIDVPPERRRIGYVFQEARLFPHYSVRGNLRYGLRRAPRGEGAIDFSHVVELLGLEGLLHRRPRDLSGGERQRVALGRALLANPRVLLMDEPLASLDQPRKDEILPFIERLRDDLQVPIVYVSHAMDEIIRLADTLVLMNAGHVAAAGPVEDLTGRLDLRPLTGRYEAGAALPAAVVGHEREYGLTQLGFAGGVLRVPALDLPIGAQLRVRIRARDVALALRPPEECSILNVFQGTVAEVGEDGGALVDLRLDVGDAPLWARITAKSLAELGLCPGRKVFAMVKAVAVDRHSLGRRAANARFVPAGASLPPDAGSGD
ncbi:molybdenum ABC transporter ATP-binding protein [Ferruginivarius sediminum]|uniref:Molybdenum ABC transporter ATP-binding protein n=1 Tax=Ferruginivarius sediminum TaxID=2661937 RepID=A0A369TLU6_9PROT|nr:molybdenum ABC transporter ATP-binding protein [Ferruginivarius sediminum]RDD63886.1 molybdenum ABC transporter ATP-binding protein [Ferruginivarius sediminum]